MSLDTSKLPALNSNIQSVLRQVGNHSSNVDHDHAVAADVLLAYGVVTWRGDPHLASNAAAVVHQVASRASNVDRKHAAECANAMGSGDLSLVAAS